MAWLWLISVGMTDVQFPVWKKDVHGQWTVPLRFESGRAGIRAVHESLLALLHNGKIEFRHEMPRPVARELARDLRLDFVQEGDVLLATIRHADYRISDRADSLPNDHEQSLPLFCPKVAALVADVARPTFKQSNVTVVVLNTRRAEGFSEAPGEPIAAGPLVAKYLAECLNLTWTDAGGSVPETLTANTSTWIDILTGNEAMEAPDAQQEVVKRLTAVIRAWNSRHDTDSKIAITTSGGMPPLKPLFERVPATCVGQQRIRLLEQPERGPSTASPLEFDARVAERETLRFHCVEALRNGDYASAYGLARRFPDLPWAETVRSRLGPLLEMPGEPLQLNNRQLESFALSACQIEIALCMGDIVGALIRLGRFIESSVWAMIPRDARIQQLRLRVEQGNEHLFGNVPARHALFTHRLLEQNSKGANRHGVVGLLWAWPRWLNHPAGRQLATAKALDNLGKKYGGKPKKYRNRYVHGADKPLNLLDVEVSLRSSGLISNMNKPFGENFLDGNNVSALLSGLGAPNLASNIGSLLEGLLRKVIEG